MARQLRLDYTATDAVSELSSLILAMAFKEREQQLEKEEKLANAELTLLAGQLADSRDDVRRSKLVYQDKLELHEDLLGPSNRVEYTGGGQDLSKDILGRYRDEITEKENEGDFYLQNIRKLSGDIKDINRLKTNLSKASKEYGDPDIWDMADYEAKVLSEQFNVDEKIIKGWRKEHPYEISQQVLDSMNLLYEESEYQAGRRSGFVKKEKAGTQERIVASNLALSPFVTDVTSILGSEDKEPEEKIKEILTLGTEHGETVGNIVLPGGTEAEQYAKVERYFNAMASFKKGSTAPKDITGLGRLADELKAQYKDAPGKADDPNTEKGILADWIYKMFNINMENIDQLYFEGYDPVTMKSTDIDYSKMSTEDTLVQHRLQYSDMEEAEYLKTHGKKLYQIFKKAYTKKSPQEYMNMIIDTLHKAAKKKE